MMMARARIAILGAGLMGNGIAQVFACAGHPVRIADPIADARAHSLARIRASLEEAAADPAALDRIDVVESLVACVADADWVFEAAPENLELKQTLFVDAERAARPEAILASNTSVIPIGHIMERVERKDRALGTHWWNPPFLVPLVEVIETQWTSPAVVARTMDLHAAAGKQPAHVKKDVPGFIGNRLQHALWREAIALVEGGICEAETVDAVIKASFGRRLAVLGPLENADLVGTDLTLAVHNIVLPAIDSRPAASPYLQGLVAEGKLGFKSGAGFRKWSQQEQSALRARLTAHLKAARDGEKLK